MAEKVRDRTLGKMRELRDTVNAIKTWKKFSFSDVPPIFANTMPKSGSHLTLQILQGLTHAAPFRHLIPYPFRMITKEGRERSHEEILRDLNRLRPGIIGWGYLRAYPEFIRFFKANPPIKMFFVTRDPRDRLISSIFYAVDIYKNHAQHAFYSSLPMDERIKVGIKGRSKPGLEHLPNVREHYDRFLGWLKCENVLTLHFEELIQDVDAALITLLDYLESDGYQIPTSRADTLSIIKSAIQPENSPTFRTGKTGNWKNYFTDEHKRLFKEIAGDLLIVLGYEQNDDW
jgi:hypothetical protein